MKITYIHHSCFLVETENCYYLFDYEKGCFVGRAYFNAPDIDGKVYFNAAEAMQGKKYTVRIEMNDSYDLYGRTEDYEGE